MKTLIINRLFADFKIWLLIIMINSGNVFCQVSMKYKKDHDKAVLSAIYSSDNTSIACISADKTIRIYNAQTGELISTLDDKGEGNISLAYSPDSKTLISACFDKSIKIWDTKNNQLECKLDGHLQPSRSVCYSTDGKYIASGGTDNTIKIWYAPTKLNFKTLTGHKQCIRSVAFSPDGQYLASSGNDLKLILWDIATGTEIFSIKASDFPIETISFSPDGNYIATSGLDNNIRIWNSKKGTLYKTLSGHTKSVFSISYSPDGKYIVSGGDDNIIKIWSIESGKSVLDINGHSKGIRTVSFSPDGKMLVSGGLDKQMRVWDTKSFKISPTLKQQKYIDCSNNGKSIAWANSSSEISTSFTKQYTVTYTLDKSNYTNYRLFVNKSEYSTTNNRTVEIVKPKTINKTKDNKIEISYDIILDEPDNEIQFFAETPNHQGYIISKIQNVKFFNLADFKNNARFRSLIISPKNYSDKKLNIGFEININFETENTNKFKDACLSQQGKLFKSVTTRCPEDNKYLTRKSIIKISDSLSTVSKKQDVFLIILSGLFVKNSNNEIFLIAPNTSLKNFESDLINLESFCSSMSKSPAFNGIIIDPTRKLLQYPKGYSHVDSKEIFEYISKNLKTKKDYAILVVSTEEYLQLFDLLFSVIYPYNDIDKNDIIDFQELNTFFSQLYKTYYVYNGRFVPLFLTY